jgi:hypothetical protein
MEIVTLEALLMPNGEVFCMGHCVGRIKDIEKAIKSRRPAVGKTKSRRPAVEETKSE